MPESASAGRPSTVLIAEDDRGVLALLDISFRNAGWTVETAADGTAALDRVAEGRFDLLVLDILMPGATGWEVLDAAVAAVPPGDPLPRAIMMTGFHQEYVVDMELLQREGVGAMLLKPFTPESLLGEAERILAAPVRTARDRSRDPARA